MEIGFVYEDANALSNKIKEVASVSRNEEDLKIEIEHLLRNYYEKIGISYRPHHEVIIATGRTDTLYGKVVIEYEAPRSFISKKKFEEAVKQIKRYLEGLSKGKEKILSRYKGVVLDGYKIGFISYKANKWIINKYDVDQYSILYLLECLRGLSKKALNPKSLVSDLGAKTKIAKSSVKVFYKAIREGKSIRVHTLFEDWKRVFSQVCGYSFESEVEDLSKLYELEEEIDISKFLFSIHTYYALVIKLLVAEIAVIYGNSLLQSYLEKLSPLQSKAFKKELEKLERGELFSILGIKNFLEEDYFSWYLSAWNEDLEKVVRGIVKALREYEPATAILEPEEVKDLFKKIYQHLVPKKMRHDLGEYYTPDWLAELVLEETGYNGDPKKRVLDPACGSGTFLVSIIKLVKEYIQDNALAKYNALVQILQNVVGFDLNPLAVITSRANYLIALGELLHYRKGSISLPIYLCDSILTPIEKVTYRGEKAYIIKSSVGSFEIPSSIIENGIIDQILDKVDFCIDNGYKAKEFINAVIKDFGEFKEEGKYLLKELYEKILKLENEGRNRIWCGIIKNSFAPIFAYYKFDYVVGNPSWINWESLPDLYREQTKPLWNRYGLFSLSGYKARLGGGKKDIAMLFTYVAVDKYLKENGILGFLITQSVFKTEAGEGFRNFTLPKKEFLKVLKVHDMVELKPFESASNMTAVIILKKTKEKTEYPIQYIQWKKIKRGSISTDLTRYEVLERTKKIELLAEPIDTKKNNSAWFTTPKNLLKLKNITGKSQYTAYAGAYSGGVNGVYWIKILQKFPNGDILIENLYEIGKKKVEKTLARIETDLIYPLIKSRNVKKWNLKKDYTYCIMVQDPKKRIGYEEKYLKRNYPKTHGYLYKFKDILLKRASYKKYFNKKSAPFYTMFGIGEYTFAPYKVVWNRMGTNLNAVVTASVKDVYIGERVIIPENVLVFVPFENELEAHYLCAIMNSYIVNFLIQSYSVKGGKSFATPDILKFLNLNKFNSKDERHKKLSELSIRAHELALRKNEDLKVIEYEIDKLVAELYGLDEDALIEVMDILDN
ncbi:MAG: Eco57I restriction-modification methylase domain-containing protein [Methanosarcinales archaeon]